MDDSCFTEIIKAQRYNLQKILNKAKIVCHKNYTIYRNTYNKLKKICKQNVHELTLYKSDLTKTWNILKSEIGKTNDKSGIPETFKIGGNLTKDPKTIADNLCQYFAEIGPEFASKISQPSKLFHSHLKQAEQNSLFMKPTDPNEILKIIMSLKPKNSTVMMVSLQNYWNIWHLLLLSP